MGSPLLCQNYKRFVSLPPGRRSCRDRSPTLPRPIRSALFLVPRPRQHTAALLSVHCGWHTPPPPNLVPRGRGISLGGHLSCRYVGWTVGEKRWNASLSMFGVAFFCNLFVLRELALQSRGSAPAMTHHLPLSGCCLHGNSHSRDFVCDFPGFTTSHAPRPPPPPRAALEGTTLTPPNREAGFGTGPYQCFTPQKEGRLLRGQQGLDRS